MPAYEELDVRDTAQGELILRRRTTPDGETVHEVTLDGHFLMSSLVHASERALSTLALERLAGDGPFDTIVGGLGLGYTAAELLADPRVGRVDVIERQGAVIDWFARGLVPLAATLTGDRRCRLVEDDFFEVATSDAPPVDAIVVDIDHSPRALLAPEHAAFYTADGIRRLRARLRPGGVFALWSADRPDDAVVALLAERLERVEAREVAFPNPHIGEEDVNTIYLGSRAE